MNFLRKSLVFAATVAAALYMASAALPAFALTYDQIITPGAVLGTNTLAYPTGTLVNDSGTIYFISGAAKVPFTNWQAFVGLGYSLKNVVKGDLSNYSLASSYAINGSNVPHPWGSWVINNGTVYYCTQSGLVGVPSAQAFTASGGSWSNVVKANKYDLATLTTSSVLPLLTANDSRVSTPSVYQSGNSSTGSVTPPVSNTGSNQPSSTPPSAVGINPSPIVPVPPLFPTPISPTPAPPTTSSSLTSQIVITVPAGGEQWALGSTHTVSWTASTSVVSVNISVKRYLPPTTCTNGPCAQPNFVLAPTSIASNVANTGSFSWTIVSNISGLNPLTAGQYILTVSDTAGKATSGNSQLFTITAASAVH